MGIDKLLHKTPALAIASVPKQEWEKPTDLKKGLRQGTIFDELNLPFYVGGETHGR